MKKHNRPLLIIYSFLIVSIIICSSVIVYKTAFRVNIMPRATGVLIDKKIAEADAMTNIAELKAYITLEFRNKEKLIREHDTYINTTLLLAFSIFIMGIICLILTFAISKTKPTTTYES